MDIKLVTNSKKIDKNTKFFFGFGSAFIHNHFVNFQINHLVYYRSHAMTYNNFGEVPFNQTLSLFTEDVLFCFILLTHEGL